MSRKIRSSVFFRYALSYMTVVMLLFCSITGYMYVRLSGKAREDFINVQINRLSRISAQHEHYLSSMLNTAEEIRLSPDIESFRYDEEPWKAYELQRKLIPYTTTNTFCDHIFLSFYGDDRIYSSSSSMELSLFSRLMRYESIPMERLTNMIKTVDRLTIIPSQQVSSTLVYSSRVVTFLVPMGNASGSGKGVLLFLIQDSEYQSLFSDAIEDEINTYIFQGDMLISSSGNLSVPTEKLTIESNAASRSFKWDDQDWTQVVYSSGNWNLSYAAVMRNSDISLSIGQQIIRNMAILPVFVILCLLLALWMAKRHSSPIREITTLLSHRSEDAPLDELQQISTGIRQLTTRNQELSTKLELALPVQRHDFVFRFIKGRFSSRTEAVAAGRAVGLDIDRACYAVILCAGATGDDHPMDLHRSPFDGLSGYSGAGVELVALKADLYLVFADEANTLFELSEMIRSEGEVCNGSCFTAVSTPHSDFEEAPTAYLEAAAAYENRFVMGNRKVLLYSDIVTNLPEVLPRARKITTAISQALSIGNRELLSQRLNDLLQFLKNTNMSPFAFRMIYSDVINSLVHTHSTMLSKGVTVQENYNIFSLTSCQSIDDLDELLRRLCDRLLSGNTTVADQNPETEDEIGQAVRYMEEHFNDPEISMAAMAESLNLSTTRFSVSFKEKTGMSPLDYLTLLRVEQAKRLLTSTELTIHEIGIQVGYYDSGSFIRRFKQVAGATPLQYRREHHENPAEMEAENTETETIRE